MRRAHRDTPTVERGGLEIAVAGRESEAGKSIAAALIIHADQCISASFKVFQEESQETVSSRTVPQPRMTVAAHNQEIG